MSACDNAILSNLRTIHNNNRQQQVITGGNSYANNCLLARRLVEKGVRGVRHRAVAERAGVSLGSTTYHFSSIEDLIISAFKYWREQKIMRINPYYLEVENRLKPYRDNVIPAMEREEMAAWTRAWSWGSV